MAPPPPPGAAEPNAPPADAESLGSLVAPAAAAAAATPVETPAEPPVDPDAPTEAVAGLGSPETSGAEADAATEEPGTEPESDAQPPPPGPAA